MLSCCTVYSGITTLKSLVTSNDIKKKSSHSSDVNLMTFHQLNPKFPVTVSETVFHS